MHECNDEQPLASGRRRILNWIFNAPVDEPLCLPLSVCESSVGREEVELLGQAQNGCSKGIGRKD
jgi:hypothetical protein